jgi:acyl-coenzyme A synthetase/AMP-(fatty) acid ligase
MIGGLSRGATLVTMPRFDLEQFLGAIQEHRVTTTIVAPPITLALAKHPLVDRYDLSSLRLLIRAARRLAPRYSRHAPGAWAAASGRAGA